MPAPETLDRLDIISSALQGEGFTVRDWTGRERRLYITRDGREFGYLTSSDDGGTGTCRNISKSGMFSAIIRKALGR